MRRPVVVVAASALVTLGCVEEQQLFDIELQVRQADGVDAAVILENTPAADGDALGLSFNYVDDLGNDNGGDPRDGKRLPFDAAATSASFSLLAFLDAVPTARGATAFLPLPSAGDVFAVPMLLATVDVGALDSLPPAIGADACYSADEQGRLFVVGGSTGNQSGYVLNERFVVAGLDGDSFRAVANPGCVAGGGSVVAVGGDGAGGVATIRQIDADADVVLIPVLPAAELAGAFAAKAGEDHWLFARNRVDLLDSAGAPKGSTAGIDVDDLESLTGGDALVLTVAGDLLLFEQSKLGIPTNLGPADAIGRRFADVVALRGSELLLIAGPNPEVLRSDVDVDVGASVVSFTVLSDDSVAALVGDRLIVDRIEGASVTKVLPRPRTHVSAIPGDTLVLAGGDGDGLDAISLP